MKYIDNKLNANIIKLKDTNNNYTSDNVEGALEEIDSKIKNIEDNGYDDTQIKQDINNIKTEIGTEELTTTAQTIKGAVNEVSSQIKEKANKLDNYRYLNVRDFGAKGDGITDDTQAFKNAMAIMNNSVIDDIFNSWDSCTYIIYIPSGVYIVSEPNILTPTHVNNMGFTIKGNGMSNSIIKYTSTDTEKYLCQIGNKNSIGTNSGFINFSDFSIYGNGNNNFFAMYSQNGAPQDVYFNNIEFRNLHHNVVIRYGSANTNADKFKFFGCNFDIPSNGIGFGIIDPGLSQSIAHNMLGCNIYSKGTVFYFKSGGSFSYIGGSCVIDGSGSFLYMNGLGSDMNKGAGVHIQDIRFEFPTNGTDYNFLNLNTDVPVIIDTCQFGQLISSKPVNTLVRLLCNSNLNIIRCTIPFAFKTSMRNEGNSNFKTILKIEDSIIPKEFIYNITNELTTMSYNVQWLGRIIIRNCYDFSAQDNWINSDNYLINVDFNVLNGFNLIPPELKTVFIKSEGGGTPYLPTNKKIYFPKGAVLKKIKFITFDTTKEVTLSVTHDNSTLFNKTVTLSTSQTIIETDEIYKLLNGNTLDDNAITISSSDSQIPGRIVIEYY